MAIDLSEFDTEEREGVVARLTEKLDWHDLQESQDCLISIQYNEIDLEKSAYHFNQPFVDNEANLYFQRMKEFSGLSVNYIVDHSDYKSHFYRSDIRGNLKRVFDSIDPKISEANPLIFHFALDPDSTVTDADRSTGRRNPRVYFMIGYNGMLHILFFDPYHELNPIITHATLPSGDQK